MSRTLRMASLALILIFFILCSHVPFALAWMAGALALCGGTFRHTPRTLQARDDLERASQRTGKKHEALAHEQGITEQAWSAQRKGEMATPSMYRLANCPDLEAEYIRARASRHHFILVEQNTLGLAAELLARMAERLVGNKRMARMVLDAKPRTERTA